MSADRSKKTTIEPTSNLKDLGITKAIIFRTIEYLKANMLDVSTANLAIELGIPRSFLYADLEILEFIYANSTNPAGHDKVILELISDIKKNNRKISQLKKELDKIKKQLETSYNDGFVQGAAMTFTKKREESIDNSASLDALIWAKGVLNFELGETMDEASIKKSYRVLVSELHPDSTGKDTGKIINNLNQAMGLLLKSLNL